MIRSRELKVSTSDAYRGQKEVSAANDGLKFRIINRGNNYRWDLVSVSPNTTTSACSDHQGNQLKRSPG